MGMPSTDITVGLILQGKESINPTSTGYGNIDKSNLGRLLVDGQVAERR